jgi:hypothetical protein
VLGCAERVFGSFEELKAFLVQEYGSASER